MKDSNSFSKADAKEELSYLSKEDIKRGFVISTITSHEIFPNGVEEVESIDIIKNLNILYVPKDDIEASERAKIFFGIKFINDMEYVEKDRFIDTPKNRELLSSIPMVVLRDYYKSYNN